MMFISPKQKPRETDRMEQTEKRNRMKCLYNSKISYVAGKASIKKEEITADHAICYII